MNAKEREFWVEEGGLVFEKTLKGEIEILVVGDDCGKTRLIQEIFGDHPGLTRTNFGTSVEYKFNLRNLFFHIMIQDVKLIDFVRKTRFDYKPVFLFCYDFDDNSSLERLKEIWIPAAFERSIRNMCSLLVGIKGEPAAGASSQQPVVLTLKELYDLCKRFHIGWHVQCSLKDRDSMLNVFQTAIDQAYPRTSIS